MILNTNTQALLATNSLWYRNNDLAKASKNLSLGTKINVAGDDPSGMAISNKMKMQIRGLEIADRNTIDAISLVQTAEGGLIEVSSMLQRLRELGVRASNDTLNKGDRENIQREIESLVDEIDSISDRVEFNRKPLLNEKHETFIFQIGSGEGQELKIDLQNVDSTSLGISTNHTSSDGKELLLEYNKTGPNGEELLLAIPSEDANGNYIYEMDGAGNYQTTATPPVAIPPADVVNTTPRVNKDGKAIYQKSPTGDYILESDRTAMIDPDTIIRGLDYTTVNGAQDAIDRCDRAIENLLEYRANLGVVQNRLQKNSNALIVSEENTVASLSRIMDTDMAEEMSKYTQNNVLVQAGIAMISQANQRPNQLLSLLQ